MNAGNISTLSMLSPALAGTMFPYGLTGGTFIPLRRAEAVRNHDGGVTLMMLRCLPADRGTGATSVHLTVADLQALLALAQHPVGTTMRQAREGAPHG